MDSSSHAFETLSGAWSGLMCPRLCCDMLSLLDEFDVHRPGLEVVEALLAGLDRPDRDDPVVIGPVPTLGIVEEAEVAPGDEVDEVPVAGALPEEPSVVSLRGR